MRPSILALIATTAAIAVAPVLVPHPLEQVTMLIRDKKYETALHVADRFVEEGETRPELLMQAFMLNERYGELTKAKAALRKYLEQRPEDADGWRKAAWVYANAHRAEPLMEALENVVRLTGEAGEAEGLARLYRLHARFGDELRVLAGADASRLSTRQALRLAELNIANEKYAEARDVLRMLDRTLPAQEKEPRLLLFDRLVADQLANEALERSRAWLASWNNGDDRATFVRHLLRAGAQEQAFALATEADVSREGAVLVYLLDILTLESRLDMLPGLIDAWVDRAALMPPKAMDLQTHEVLSVASERGMQAALFQHLHRSLARKDRPEIIASLAEALVDQFGQIALAPYRAALSNQVLAARPVLAARLFQAEGNLHAARHYLLQADIGGLSKTACDAWMKVAEVTLGRRFLMETLAGHARTKGLPACLPDATSPTATHGGPQALLRFENTGDRAGHYPGRG